MAACPLLWPLRAPARGKRDLPGRNEIWGQASGPISLPLPRVLKPHVPSVPPPRGSGEGDARPVWTRGARWFLLGAEGKSQLCCLWAVGLRASDSTSLSPCFFICKIRLMTHLADLVQVRGLALRVNCCCCSCCMRKGYSGRSPV